MIERRLAIWLLTAAACGVAGGAGGSLSGQVPDTLQPDTLTRDSLAASMEPLRVRAARPAASASGASVLRLNLGSPAVTAAPLLEDALRRIPFVHVRENSRGEAQLTLRGTGSRQIAVLVDGIPLTLGWDARTDLSLIPVDAARSVELFRGVSSVLHGPNVLGGVVSIGIGRGEAGPGQRLSAVQGSVDGTGSTVGAARLGRKWRIGEGHLSLQAGAAHRARGGVPLPGGIEQPPDADPGERLNSDLRHASAFFTGRYESRAGSWIAMSTFGYGAEKGVPPELHVSTPRRWRIPDAKRIVTTISAGTAPGSMPPGKGSFEVNLGLDLGSTETEAFESLAYERVFEREFADHRTLILRARSEHELGGGVLRSAFTWASARHVERVGPGDVALPDDQAVLAYYRSVYRQHLTSFGAEVELPVGSSGSGFWSDARISAGASLDHSSTPETGGLEPRSPIYDWGARIGGSVQAGRAARLHAGVSRRVRFPSLRELYSGALGRFIANPWLGPEELRAIESGVTATFAGLGGAIEAQAVLFYQNFSNAIVRVGVLGDGRFQRQNRKSVGAAGLELLGGVRWGEVVVGGDVTVQKVSLRSDLVEGGPLYDTRQRAEYQPEFAAGVTVEGPVMAGLKARAGLEMVGRQYCVNPDLGIDVAIESTTRIDLGASRRVRIGGPFDTLLVSLSLDNVTDAAVYDQCGLPQPGRLLRLQVQLP